MWSHYLVQAIPALKLGTQRRISYPVLFLIAELCLFAVAGDGPIWNGHLFSSSWISCDEHSGTSASESLDQHIIPSQAGVPDPKTPAFGPDIACFTQT